MEVDQAREDSYHVINGMTSGIIVVVIGAILGVGTLILMEGMR